ncbi:MAG: sialidase family protein [Acidobacteriaceae bacterium]
MRYPLLLLTGSCCALLLVAGRAAAAQAGSPLPPAPHASVVDLTPQPGYFTEPAIAIDPGNPQHVVAAFQDNAHAGYSTDGGKTWRVAAGVSSTRFRVSGDVSIAYDTQGHAIICYMAFDKLGTFNYWGHDSSRNGLFVRRSMDGGHTWEANDIPVIQHADGAGVPWEDKPYLVADDTHGPDSGNLYIGWTRWTLTDSEIWLTRSTDDGLSWSKPIEIDQHPGLPRDDNGALEGFAGAVAPDGTLYVVWAGDGWLQYTMSRNGGRTFSKPRNILRTAPIMFQVEDVARSNGFPQIAVDAHLRGKPRLYVTWSDYRNGDVDVFTASSANGGKTWGPAVRVNDDPVHDGADQFFQWMTVDPADGSVDVVFYDRRGDPKNRDAAVTLARSTDEGRSFTNYAWTTHPFDAGRAFLGDYTGITARNGHVYGIWTTKPGPARGTQIQIGDAYFGKDR